VRFVEFIGSVFLAFLPPRYRRVPGLRDPAIVSAVLEGSIAVGFLIGRIYAFVSRPGLVPDKLANQLFVKKGGEFLAANAVAGAASFWLDPIVWVCLYFFFESVVRYFAAIEGSSIIGTLPLYGISMVHGLMGRAAHRRYLGALVADEVRRGNEKLGYAVEVRSCRPKLDWNRLVTVEYQNEFYECYREDQGPPPRRFVYYLRKSPANRLVVVIRKYDPNDVLDQ